MKVLSPLAAGRATKPLPPRGWICRCPNSEERNPNFMKADVGRVSSSTDWGSKMRIKHGTGAVVEGGTQQEPFVLISSLSPKPSPRHAIPCTTDPLPPKGITFYPAFYTRCSIEVRPRPTIYSAHGFRPEQKRTDCSSGREARWVLEGFVCLFCSKQLIDCLLKQRNEIVMFSLCLQ